MGLNEFAGYLAVAASALATGWIAAAYGLRPQPFYLGVAFVVVGLALSVWLVRDTTGHVSHESAAVMRAAAAEHADAARGVLAHDAARSEPVERQPGGPDQQPE